ncbi:hypothetical protein GN958_ATG07143 [Phytophthora infestans]|uniref:Uncharacterized protein n=1 Tax=Phytophthora infestans TaxID=4787 RepID=A0A8S9UX09_PHYIN|nr:hypothetical protein GN958_ATG07143 [Phytophthora infestans]
MSAIITATPCRPSSLHAAITKSSKKSGTPPTVEDQLRTHLDDEDRGADDATPLHFMIEFWSRLRAVISANCHSVVLDALDRLVLRLLAGDTSQAPLDSAALILPSPDSMSAGQVREHSVFQTPPLPAKKQRTSKKAKAKPRFAFDLPTGVDSTIERDFKRFVKFSEGQGKPPPRMEELPRLFGGRAAKHASWASDDSKFPAQEDLGVRHRRRYDQVIANALDPFEVDSSSSRSIPELLEKSLAIDPTRPKNLRLSVKALDRVALDVSGSNPPKESWFGNRNRGPWKTLLSNRSLRVTQVEVAMLLTAGKPVIVHNDRPFQPSEQGEDDSTSKKTETYYLGLSSDDEDQEPDEGHPGSDHDDEEDKEKAQEDINEDVDDQDDEGDDDEAAENPPFHR